MQTTLKLEPLIAAKAKAQQLRKPKSVSQNSGQQKAIKTDKELARIAGVSHDTIAKVKLCAERKAGALLAGMDLRNAHKANLKHASKGHDGPPTKPADLCITDTQKQS